MNPNTLASPAEGQPEAFHQSLIPQWLKIACTAFVSVLVPVYWASYGPTNFLYFCDVALLITLYAVWAESSLAASRPHGRSTGCRRDYIW